jgi:3-hydroxybutyryl-CoA dehydrogenase
MKIDTVGIVGAGVMGAGIAEAIARAGVPVTITDAQPGAVDRALARIEVSAGRALERGKITPEEVTAIGENVHGGELNDLRSCSLVIEAVVEDISAKESVISALDDTMSPDAIIATNTSSLSITQIASTTRRPERVVGMHFFNPVPVMKLVEVIPGIRTSEAVTTAVRDFAAHIGKSPAVVSEGPGFLVNRILVPMVNEAIGIFAEGAATAEDIDNAMKLGANHPIGPLALGDLIGTDVCLAIMEVLHREFGDDKYRPHPLLRKMVRGGLLGRKSGRGFYEYQTEGMQR